MKHLIGYVATFSCCLPLLFNSIVYAKESSESKNLPSLIDSEKLEKPLPANLFVELAKLVNPAVVNIWTKTESKEKPHPRSPYQRDPFFDLFEQFLGPQYQRNHPRESMGTGFVIQKDGLIITNSHVVDGADTINVKFNKKGQASFDAKVIGKDARTDIALIKIQSKQEFPTIRLGNSSNLQVGEWVAAFGNPLGLGHTVTKGIVSAIGREIGELNRFPFIQTDASINPGNSGGPLVDTKGYVIGVNTAIAQGNGIGFAIPIDDVKIIVKKLQKSGKVIRGFIGVTFSEITDQAMKYFKLKNKKGVLVTSVLPNGPAAEAGLQEGDILIRFEDKELFSTYDLVNSVANSDVGSTKRITLLREGKERKFNLTIQTHPEDRGKGQLLGSSGRSSKPGSGGKSYQGQKAPFDLGFYVESFSQGLAQKFRLSSLLKKPIVLDVIEDSAAQKADLQPGDQILKVNRKNVRSAKDVIRKLKNGPNALVVDRQGARRFIFMEP